MRMPWYYGKFEDEIKDKGMPGAKMYMIWKPNKFNIVAVFIMGILTGKLIPTITIHWNRLLWWRN